MFTYKLFVNAARKNALTLRITYRRQKAELSLGFCVSEDELAGILSGEPSAKNRQLASLVAIWLGKIEGIKIRFAKKWPGCRWAEGDNGSCAGRILRPGAEAGEGG